MINLLTKVRERLTNLGFITDLQDEALINHAIEQVTNHIKTETNQKDIPNLLVPSAIDMVVGEFLYLKKVLGLLDITTLDFSAAVKSISEGDTNISFAINESDTVEAKFDKFVDSLRNPSINYSNFRRLKW